VIEGRSGKSRKEENRENNEHLLPKPLTSNCYDQTDRRFYTFLD